ncbi:hypothetical protein [Actinobacillus vicugnae]|uniref:hypothetical protein n=1 Tax=Actinobacillus vicugnae TaxID=2573093 RepID=UPI00124290B2|nr:hypothetical protein [Actinobacillus vicugnae]
MYALDNKSGIEKMPEIPEVFSKTPLWFTEGRDGNAPSYPGAHWFNIVQAELLNVLKEAGIEPEKADTTQLAKALKVLSGQVESIEALRQFEPVRDRQIAYVKGYYAGSNVGGGYFIADLNNKTAKDDGSIVIITANGARWSRIMTDEAVYFEWFGVLADNASPAINAALAYTAQHNNGHLKTVKAQSNYYNLKNTIYINGNTHVDFCGATLNKDFYTDTASNAVGLIHVVHNDSAKNIIIENANVLMNGHTLTSEEIQSGNAFSIGPIKKLTMRNINVYNIKNVHAVDLSNYEDVLIENCKFYGAIIDNNTSVGSRHFTEAIQLQGTDEGSNYINSRAVIKNCYFGASEHLPAWASGVGNHGGYDKMPSTMTTIVDSCVFDGMSYAGVRTFSAFKDVKVTNCTFKGLTGAALACTNRDAWADYRGAAEQLIFSNNVVLNHTGYACVSFLRNLKNTDQSKDNLFAQNIIISNNTFESNKTAIRAFGVKNITILGNTCYGADFLNAIEIQNAIISNNIIESLVAGKTGIWIYAEDNKDSGYQVRNENLKISNNVLIGFRRAIHAQAVDGIAIDNNMIKRRAINSSDNSKNIPMIAIDSSSTKMNVLNNTYDDSADGITYDNSYLGLSLHYADHYTVVKDNYLAGMRCHISGTPNTGAVSMTASGSPNGIVTAPANSQYFDTSSNQVFIRKASANGASGWFVSQNAGALFTATPDGNATGEEVVNAKWVNTQIKKERLLWSGSSSDPISVDVGGITGSLYVLVNIRAKDIWFSAPIGAGYNTYIGQSEFGGENADKDYSSYVHIARATSSSIITLTPEKKRDDILIKKVVVLGG